MMVMIEDEEGVHDALVRLYRLAFATGPVDECHSRSFRIHFIPVRLRPAQTEHLGNNRVRLSYVPRLLGHGGDVSISNV